MSSVYTGALIAESLRPAAAIEGFPLTVTKIYRAKFGHADAGQPELWTMIEFAVPADHAPELAETLSRMLGKQGGWASRKPSSTGQADRAKVRPAHHVQGGQRTTNLATITPRK
jgi:hypothetical protein